jgi:hypothetical protein
MDRITVGSSTMVSMGYDPQSQTLEVEFQNGSIYQYYNVDAAMFDQFNSAPSKGQFLHVYIKNAYPYSRVG